MSAISQKIEEENVSSNYMNGEPIWLIFSVKAKVESTENFFWMNV